MYLTYFGAGTDIVPLLTGKNYEHCDIEDIFICDDSVIYNKVINLLREVKTFIYIDKNVFDVRNDDLDLFIAYIQYKIKLHVPHPVFKLDKECNMLTVEFGGNEYPRILYYMYRTSFYGDIITNEHLYHLVSQTDIFYIHGVCNFCDHVHRDKIREMFKKCKYIVTDDNEEAVNFAQFIDKSFNLDNIIMIDYHNRDI